MNLNSAYLSNSDLERMGFQGVGSNVKIHPLCVIPNPDTIRIGSNVRIDAFAVLSAKHIQIGAYTHIASGVTMVGQAAIVIGNFCGISHGARIFSSTDDLGAGVLTNPLVPDGFGAVYSSRVHIESHAIVGASSVVMPGVHIGKGSILGAMSYLKKNIPEFEIWGGVPAKSIKPRSRELEKLEAALIKRMGPIE